MSRDLELLNEEIEQCKRCPLHTFRTKTVPGVGPETAEIMFVGEAPGPDEDATGVPFVGRAGQVLRGIISEVGLQFNNIFLANTVKCFPTDGEINQRGGYQFRKPSENEMDTCQPYLKAQLAIVRPKVVIPLGQVPTSRWFPGVTMGEIHGVLRRTPDFLLAPTYHPSAVARGNAHLRELMLEDIRRASSYAGILNEQATVSGL